jgi:uncharacterized protein involved in type VI secretion and phage assembly
MALFTEHLKGSRTAVNENGGWIICEFAKVVENEDPDQMGRIKVSIPSIDPDNVWDDWVMPIASHCLGNGFGMLMIPPKGAEVIISGILGQKSNLVYHAAIYNEDNLAPEEFTPETAGIKTPANLSFIATLLALLKGENVELYATQLLKQTAEDIEITATATNAITGEQLELSAGDKLTAVGNEIEITSDGSLDINGGTVVVDSSGSITIKGVNVTINPSGSLKLFARTVNKIGPAI